MIQNKILRNAVFNALKGNIKGVDYYHNGQPVFIDADKETPALAVYIPEVETTELEMGGGYWSAKLHIIIYLRSINPADDLDDLLEQVVEKMKSVEFANTEGGLLESCLYSLDEKQAQWIAGTLQYDFTIYKGED